MQRIFKSIGRQQRVINTPLRMFAASPQPNPFDKGVKTSISHNGESRDFYKLPNLNDSRIGKYNS
jgi:hypothetical protein